MSGKPLDPRELGYYFTLAQIGLEMVIPLAAGVLLERYLDWAPWGAVVGAGLGLCMGLIHLVTLSNRQDGGTKPKQGP